MAHIAIEDKVAIDGIQYELPNIFLFAGKIKSGKSYALRYIVQESIKQGKFKWGWIFCKTAWNGSYMWADPCVTNGYSEAVLGRYMARLMKMREEKGRDMPPNFIIFDDLIAELNPNSKYFNQLITTCRHYNTSIFLATQYIKGNITKPVFREQVRYVFSWPNGGLQNDKNLYESFCSSFFDNVKQMRSYFNAITDDQNTNKHFAMLIDTSARSIREGIKRFQAGKIMDNPGALWATKKPEVDEKDREDLIVKRREKEDAELLERNKNWYEWERVPNISTMSQAQKVAYFKQRLGLG